MKRHGLPTWFWIILILLVSLVVLWPLLRSGFFITDDGEWMIIRLSAFYQSLAEGQFPVRFLGRLNHSYGYPVANFLYPGFLYIGSVLHRIGFSFVDSIKLILAGSVVGAAYLLFFGLRQRHQPLSSFMGTLGFLFMPYILFDLYWRGSIGEVLAIFAAVLVWFSVSARKVWIFPWAIALLLISHNSLALLFMLFIVGYLFVERLTSRYWTPLLMGIGMAAFFWLPAISERKFVFFDAVSISDPARYFIDIKNLYLLNLIPMIAAALLFTGRKNLKNNRMLLFYFGTFIAGTLLATPVLRAVWQFPLLVKLFQFPYRFLSIAVITGPLLIAAAFETVKKQHKAWLMLLCVITWFIPWWISISSVEYVQREEGYYTTNEGTTTVANEYMPRWVNVAPTRRAVRPVEFFTGKGTIDLAEHSTQKINASIKAEEQSIVQINTVYYPGWGALVDGVPTLIDYGNSGGVIRVAIPAGSHHLNAEFRETVSRFAADIVSLIAGIFALVYSVGQLTKRHRGGKS